MAFSFKTLKKRFVSYAFNRLADGADAHNRLQLLLVMIVPEIFNNFNIYAFPKINIKAFATDIEASCKTVKDISTRIERKETLVSVFDSLEVKEISIHSFFTDTDGFYVDIVQPLTTIVNCLIAILQYLDANDETNDISLRRNQAIIKSNLPTFTDFVESLYSLQKEIQ